MESFLLPTQPAIMAKLDELVVLGGAGSDLDAGSDLLMRRKYHRSRRPGEAGCERGKPSPQEKGVAEVRRVRGREVGLAVE